MPLATGAKLGPYEVVGPLGAGGWERYIVRGIRVWNASLRLRFCLHGAPLIVTSDGQRFLVSGLYSSSGDVPLTLVMNWDWELKKR
jgi:hypothetical protein